MKRFTPYILLFLVTCGFFWQFVLLGRIPIDVSPLYRMRPWSPLPNATKLAHEFDSARYYHNVDPIIEVLPIKRWLTQHLRNGDVPLWTPALFSGAPFAANHHAAPWDPSSLLFLTFPPEVAFAMTLLLHLFIAGACTYFYCKVLGCSPFACALAACAFMFNSFFLHWLGLISFNAGLVWMPLVPAGIELALQKKDARYLAIVAVALGLSFLSGMAQFWLFNLVLFLTYGIYRVATTSELRVRWGLGLIICVLLGTGIGAVQIYQTVFAFQHTSRGSATLASPYAGRNHLSPRKIPTLVVPDLYGHHQENVFSKLLLNPADALATGLAGRLVWGEKGSVFHRSWGYIGMIPILFLLIGFRKPSPPFRFHRWMIVAVLGFQILLCWQAFHRFCLWVMPAFDTLDHTRTIALFSFSGAVLAAHGIDSARRESLRNARLFLLAAAVLGLLLILLLWIKPIDVNGLVRSIKNPRPDLYSPAFFTDAAAKITAGIQQSAKIFYFPIFLMAAIILFISLVLKDRMSLSGFKAAMLILTICDLYYRGWYDPQLVYAKRSDIYPSGGLMLEFLQNDRSDFRIFELHKKRPLPALPLTNYSDLERVRKGSIRFFDPLSVEFVYRPNTLMPSGVFSAGGYMSLYPGRYKDLWEGRGMDILKAFRPGQSAESWNMPWLGMQSIKYVLLPEEIRTGSWKPAFQADGIQAMELQSHMPAVSIVSRSRIFADPNQLLRALRRPDFKPQQEVLLEEDPKGALSGTEKATVQIVSRSPDEIHFKTNLTNPAYAVISQNLFPGWRATVNGREQSLLRANYAFSCLRLGNGSHDITLKFEPPFYKASLYVSILAIAVTLFVLVVRGRR